MNRGVIGVPTDSSHLQLEEVEDDVIQGTGEHGNELTAAIKVKEVRDLYGETTFYLGEAFKDREEEVDRYHIDDEGKMRKRPNAVEVVQDHTNFLLYPGNDDHRGFVVTDSGAGTFVFSMIARQNHITTVDRADLRLGEWVQDRADDLSTSTAGGRTGSFEATKMTAWGDDVLEDEDVQDLLSGSLRGDGLNQIAGTYTYDQLPYQVTLAASGYAEVYNPSDLTTEEFLQWLSDEVIPYAVAGEDDDESSAAQEGSA